MKKLLLAAFLGCFSFAIQAQMGWELGGYGGVSYYFGDLNSSYSIATPGPAAGVAARWNFNERTCLKFSGNFGSISADDANSSNSFEQARNLHFRSLVFDGTAQFEFNFLPYIHGSKEEFYTPYLFAGFSVFNFNPQAEYNGDWVDLRPLGTEGQFRGEEYFTTQAAFAVGGGFKIDLSYRWSINAEISARRLFTDYVDDVSGNYPDMDDLEALNGQIAVDLSDRSIVGENEVKIGQTGRQRGSDNKNDIVIFAGVGLMYYFGDIRCPTYSRPGGKKRRR